MTEQMQWDASGDEQKRYRLRRIKLIATALLPVMAALFAISARLKTAYPALAWLEAFSEAALVGGLADWFAVVALFRHPAGLPLPHTAIVPNNKDRIGTQLGLFVEANFLTPSNITAKLGELDLATPVLGWFARPANTRRLIAVVREYLPRLVDAVDEPEIERLIGRVVSEEIDRLDFATLAAAALRMLSREGRHQRFLDEALRAIAAWLGGNRTEIKARFGRRSTLTPPWVDAYIVNRFVDGIIDLIDEISRTPSHEMRVAFDEYLDRLIAQFDSDPELRRKAGEVKASVLRGRELGDVVSKLWRAIKARLTGLSDAPDTDTEAWLAATVAKVARGVLQDPALVTRLNANVRTIIEAGLSRFQHHFATLIEDVVHRWDAKFVTEKVELELGPDLQFIRLNGTFIGGLAGVALHAGLVLTAISP